MTKTEVCNLALAKIGQTLITSIDNPNDKNARLCRIHYGQARDEALRAAFWDFATGTLRLSPEVALTSYARVLDATTAAALGIDATYTHTSTIDDKDYYTNGDGDLVRWDAAHVTYGDAWILYDGATAKFYSNDDVAQPELVETWVAVNGASGTPAFTTLLDDQLDGWGYAFALPADYLKLYKLTGEALKIDAFALRRANGKRCLLCDTEDPVLHYVASIDTPTDYDPLFTAALITLLASKLARAITGSDGMETTLLQRYETVDLPAARTANGHDSQSAENHPLEEILAGNLMGARGSFFGDDD